MPITPTQVRTETRRRVHAHAIRTGESIRRIRLEAGLSRTDVGRIASVDPSYLARIEAGTAIAPVPTLIAIGLALGCDTSLRLFEGAGPRLHDRFQAPMVEALVKTVHADRWTTHLEVPVGGPGRGVIDAVLDERRATATVATELQSSLPRLEQQVRWMHEKADALGRQRAEGGDPREVGGLLILRSTTDTRAIATAYAATLQHAFPARVVDVLDALATPTAPWPGSGLIWMHVERGVATMLDGPPRGVRLGR